MKDDGTLVDPESLASMADRASAYVRRALPGLDPEPWSTTAGSRGCRGATTRSPSGRRARSSSSRGTTSSLAPGLGRALARRRSTTTCPASCGRRPRSAAPLVMEVHVEREERYWYPDDGGVVWLTGYQLVDPESGDFIGRDSPKLAERGLRVAGVAGARSATARRSSRTPPRRAPAGPQARPEPHDPNAIAVHAGGSRWAGCRASWPRSWRRGSTQAPTGRRSCSASSGRALATRAPGSRCS